MSDDIKTQLSMIGSLIAKARRIKFPNDSQEKFGERIGVSPTTINKMETGKGNVGFTSYLNALNALNLSDRVEALSDTESLEEIEIPKW